MADDKGEGAGLRISGHPNPRSNKLTGDSGWTSLAYEFDVTDSEHDVIVVCELRSQKGQTLFEEQSLRLVPWAP